ncbi:MAG: hypothetical protein RBU30_12345, partial [Polyangia bacterium]|nr:hypothetical protein [Polyangia bacterium]
MQTRTRAVLVSVFPILLLSTSCTIPIDDRITVNDDGGVDFTEYAGVQIIGTVSIDGAPANPGPLDLGQLAAALYTKCIDAFTEENEPVLMGYCTSATGAFTSECCKFFCDSVLYNCLANELMTLAESTDVFEFVTEIRNYSAERIGEEIVFDIEEGRKVNPLTETRASYAYRIPRSE